MNNRYVMVGPTLRQVVSGHNTLARIAAGDAKHGAKSLLGQLGVRRARTEEQYARVLIDSRGGDGRPGAKVAYDGVHLRLHELAGSGDRLLGVAVIVDWKELDLPAENAAGRIQLGDLHVHAALHLL